VDFGIAGSLGWPEALLPLGEGEMGDAHLGRDLRHLDPVIRLVVQVLEIQILEEDVAESSEVGMDAVHLQERFGFADEDVRRQLLSDAYVNSLATVVRCWLNARGWSIGCIKCWKTPISN